MTRSRATPGHLWLNQRPTDLPTILRQRAEGNDARQQLNRPCRQNGSRCGPVYSLSYTEADTSCCQEPHDVELRVHVEEATPQLRLNARLIRHCLFYIIGPTIYFPSRRGSLIALTVVARYDNTTRLGVISHLHIPVDLSRDSSLIPWCLTAPCYGPHSHRQIVVDG